MSSDPFEQLAFFDGLCQADRALLRQIFTPCDFSSNTHLFEQGDIAEYLYLVVSGEVVVVFKPDDGPPITVARVLPGGVVGWSAALGSKIYTSGAQCSVYTQLLRARGADLRRLCVQHNGVGLIILDRLATVIAQRLSKTHDQVVALLEMGLRNGNRASGG